MKGRALQTQPRTRLQVRSPQPLTASQSETYRDLKLACLACMELWVYFTRYDIKTKPLNSPETNLTNLLFSWAENNLFTETRTYRLLFNMVGHNLQQKY